MPASSPFGRTVDDLDGLRALYRQPSPLVQGKVQSGLDDASRRFISRSPFVLVGTSSADGRLDVSPRGGPPGFVRVLTDPDGADLLALPDLNGNNLLDTFTNVVATGRVGMLFVVPGKDETLRVNGRAWVVTDDAVLDACASTDLARPKAVLGVAVDEAFIHCAKSFRRGQVWQPDSWGALADAPDGADMICAAGLLPGVDPELVRNQLAQGYDADLIADRPT
jgi:PPOX class probable FMN-dependent enzyme